MVTTHILGDIERVADRVAILERGKMVLEGDLDELREQVREVEISAGESLDNVQVMGRRTSGGAEICWVRSNDRQALDGLSRRGSVRGVSLEDLFLALTKYRVATERAS